MSPWMPIIAFLVAIVFLRVWHNAAQAKFHPHGPIDWVILAGLALVVIAVVGAVQHLQAAHQPVTPGAVTQSWHNPLDDFDACTTTGQKGGPPVTNNPGCPGYVYNPPPEIDASTFGSHPDLGPVPTLTSKQMGTR